MSEKGKGVSSTPSLNITESKQAEEELARLSEAVRMSADSIVISDMEGKITYVNEATLKMYGTDDPKDLLGKSSFELIAPEDREKAFAGMREVMKKGYSKDKEYQLISKSGNMLPVEMSTSLIKSKTGEAVGFVGITRDITERKRMEEALRESEMKYKLLFESSGSAITYFDTEGKCVFLNRRGAKYLGGEAEEFIGKSIYDIFPETANFYVQRFTKIMNEGKGYIFEDSVELPDGKRWFSSNIQPVTDESGTVRGIQIISDDITEHKRAEEELRSSEERLRILFEYAPDAYYLSDLKGNFVDGNKAAEEITGYKRDELIGKSFLKLKLLSPRQIPKAAALLTKNALGLSTGPDEFILNWKDGNQVPVEIRTFPVKIKGQTLVLGIARDITERKRMEHDLKERVKELQCLYGIARIDERPGITPDELYQEVANLLPASWQYPEITCARIVLNDKKFETENHKETKWKQSSDIKVYGAKAGQVEVSYLEERPGIDEGPFSKEERLLIDAVAKQLGNITERKRAEEALSNANVRLRVLQRVIAAVHSTLDLEEVFKQITDGAAYSLGYTTALILTLNDEKKCFEIKALSTQKRLLPQIGKVLGFSLKNLSIPADSEFQAGVRSVLEGRVAIAKSMTEIAYPIISKKMCSALEKLGGTRNYIVVPLKVREEVVGALFITSPREKVSEEELTMLQNFARAASQAIRNANLHSQTKQAEAALRASHEELQATNEELRDAQEKLVRSERLAAIGQLAGGVGHELRNPLSAIKNAVYYVRGKVAKSELGQKEPQVIEFLDIMDDEINSSSKIINDLLGFSRVGKPTVSPTRIERVIDDALSYTTIPENIELTKKLDTDLPEVKIDTDQVRQVLVNMILNAVQAMPTGGKLTINAREKDKFLEVEITDTGCGMPHEVMVKIFDPLFTTRAKGIGLGLAVCKAIIDRHTGYIEVKSEVEKGTTFIIKLPLRAE